MRVAREKRGAIDFDTTETRIVFREDRKIERIVPVYRNDAHMLIEECMIAANVCAADFLLKNKIPALYRIHEVPGAEKLADLREFLGELGLGLRGGDEPQAKDYAQLLSSIKGRPDAHLIQTVLLRSLRQAQYSPDNIGHFGLAHEGYAHFTSPIRRYPDLLVHRAIRHLLQHGKARGFAYDHNNMLAFGEHCSMTDRRADEATRDAVNWLKCEYMQDKVGEEFDGVISSVTSFGLFIELDEIYVEGLVHVTALDNDYYHFDPANHRLRGERSAKVYRLGDRIRVRVVRVDLDERKIDFDLVVSDVTAEAGVSGGDKKASRKKKPGKKKVVSKKKATPAKKSAAKKKGAAATKHKKVAGKKSSPKKRASVGGPKKKGVKGKKKTVAE
jgi:ribonuclease R